MLQNTLTHQSLHLWSWQIVLTVLFQMYYLAIIQLKLAIILQTTHLNVQGFGRPQISSQINALAISNGTHIGGQRFGIVIEEGHLRFAQSLFYIGGNYGTKFPAQSFDALQTLIQIGQQAAFVSLQGGMTKVQQGPQGTITGGGVIGSKRKFNYNRL